MGKHSAATKLQKLWGPASLDRRIGPAAAWAISESTRRRNPRLLSAAASGLLGVAFMPAGAALADDYTITPDGTETITGIYGNGLGNAGTAPPAAGGSVQGSQTFSYTDNATGTTGTFTGDENTFNSGFDITNTEVVVTSSSSGTDAPSVGSVFDTYTFGDSGYANIYSDVPSADGGVITDTWVTPDGSYAVPLTFAAANIPIADATGVPLADGDYFVPIASSDKLISVNGIPPLDIALQASQNFTVDGAAGDPLGTFSGEDVTTTDIAGTYTEAVLVTKDLTGAAYDPPVGSVLNSIMLYGWANYYSDLTSTTGGPNTITDTLVSPWGQDYTVPTTFDAAALETPVSVNLPDGDIISADPSSAEVFNGVNGLPPLDFGVQGGQEFDLLSSGGTLLGTFDADETKTIDLVGDVAQALLVTKDLSGDSLPVGSVIETLSLGSGFENIYTDIASTVAGGDVYADTLVTPFGDITIPLASDFVAGLGSDFFNILP